MREAGLSIETLQKYVDLFKQGNKTLAARKQLLRADATACKHKLKPCKQP